MVPYIHLKKKKYHAVLWAFTVTFIEKHYSLLLTLQSYVNNYHHKAISILPSWLYNQLDSKDSFEPLNIMFLFTMFILFLGQNVTHLLKPLSLCQAVLLVKLLQVPSC